MGAKSLADHLGETVPVFFIPVTIDSDASREQRVSVNTQALKSDQKKSDAIWLMREHIKIVHH